MFPSVALPGALSQLLLASLVVATPDIPHNALAQLLSDSSALVYRALPNSPSGDYAPAIVSCPAARPILRSAHGLSSNETDWLALRRPQTVDPMVDFLNRVNISGFDAETYIRDAASKNLSALPNIAIAVSGGGYRALMNGAGFLKAADNRTAGATDAHGLGGLLQATTYLSGLSGGGWLVGSIFGNNFSTVENLQTGSTGSAVWKFDNSIFKGPEDKGISIVNTAEYWVDIARQVDDKDDAGFDTSLTDYWGRALSYQLINDTDGGPAYTFSSIALADSFIKAETPFPILVVDGRAPDEIIIDLNATNFEFTPFEMGSFDPDVYGFAPMEYLGSNFSNGSVPSTGNCVRGFDQLGYVMGTSSTLFNQFLLTNLSAYNVPTVIINAVDSILKKLGSDNNDIAQYVPNPFLHWNPDTNPGADSLQLSLVDGGEDLQNIPLTPLIQDVRAVDVIFAVDSSADTTYSWPNATALRATYARTRFSDLANGTTFPAVPDAETFVNNGLNARPVFFGCNASNITNTTYMPPLIVYLPNAPLTAYSNVSTFDLSYELSQRDSIILNGYNAATRGNGTLDSEWPTCVGCAILSRSLWRTGTDVPEVCTRCFDRYCWDGTTNSTTAATYEPVLQLGNGSASTEENAASRPAGMAGASWAALAVAVAAWAVVVPL